MPCPGDTVVEIQTDKIVKDYTETHPYEPERIYKPKNLRELVSSVQEAEKRGKKIKAQGSGYSLSEAAKADDDLICTDHLNRWLSLPEPTVRDAMEKIGEGRFRAGSAEQHLQRLRRPEIPLNQVSTLIYVEAGIKIKHLLADLDAVNMALPTMGAGGGQSLAGAISTGTHGSDFRQPPLSDRIRAVHLVGPGGQEWWIEPTFGMVGGPSLAQLPRWCPDTKVVRSDQWLRAAMVTVGRLGVVYAVVLEVTDQFRLLDQSEKGISWTVVRTQLDATALALKANGAQGNHDPMGVFVKKTPQKGEDFPLRFYQVTVDLAKGEKCWVTRRWRTENTVEENATTEKVSSFDSLLCGSPGMFGGMLAGLQALPEFQLIRAGTLAVPFAGGPWMVAIDALIAELMHFAATSATVGDFMARVAQRLSDVSDGSHGPLAGRLKDLIMTISAVIIDSRHEEQRIGKSHQIVDGHPDNRRGCLSAHSAEFFFSAADQGYLQFVNRILQHSTKDGIPGYASLRFVGGSEAFIAMERFRWTVAIEIAVPRRQVEGGDLFREFTDAMHAEAKKAGGIPHWGQRQRVNADDIEGYYGASLERWRYVLAEIEHGQRKTFSTQFSTKVGLEVKDLGGVKKQRAEVAAMVLATCGVVG